MDIISIIISLIVGFVIGFIVRSALKRTVRPNTKDQEVLRLKQEFGHYQKQVSQHMAKTADLMNSLKQQYDAIQEHIFTGATTLNRDSDRHSFLQPKTHETYTDPAIEALVKKQQAHKNTTKQD